MTAFTNNPSDYPFFEGLTAKAKEMFAFVIALPFSRENLHIATAYFHGDTDVLLYNDAKNELIFSLLPGGRFIDCSSQLAFYPGYSSNDDLLELLKHRLLP